jgi:hypothetical protein
MDNPPGLFARFVKPAEWDDSSSAGEWGSSLSHAAMMQAKQKILKF